MTSRWFFPGSPISSIKRTSLHDIAELLLKVALNTIKPNQTNLKSNRIWPTELVVSKLRAFIDLYIVLSMSMLSYGFVIACGLLGGSEFVQVFYRLFIYVLPLEIQLEEKRVGILLAGWTLPQFMADPSQDPDFQRRMSWSFFFLFSFWCVQWFQLRWEVIILFVDIGGMMTITV